MLDNDTILHVTVIPACSSVIHNLMTIAASVYGIPWILRVPKNRLRSPWRAHGGTLLCDSDVTHTVVENA